MRVHHTPASESRCGYTREKGTLRRPSELTGTATEDTSRVPKRIATTYGRHVTSRSPIALRSEVRAARARLLEELEATNGPADAHEYEQLLQRLSTDG